MEYWQFSLVMSLLLIGALAAHSIRLRLVLGGPKLRITTGKQRTILVVTGLVAIFYLIPVIITSIDLSRGGPEPFMEFYRYQLFRAIPTAVAGIAGFIAVSMEGQIREEGINYRGMHTWDQILYYQSGDYWVRIVTSKNHWLSGKPKEIVWKLQDSDPLIDVERALRQHGIEKN